MYETPLDKSPMLSTAAFIALTEASYTLLKAIASLLPSCLPSLARAENYQNWFVGATVLVLSVGALINWRAFTKRKALPLLLNYATCASLLVVFQQYHDGCHTTMRILATIALFISLPWILGPWIKTLRTRHSSSKRL